VIREEGRVPDELPSQIDRSFQRSLLLWMRDKYPSMAYKVPTSLDGNDRRFYFNLFYLKEHGLCEALAEKNLDGSISWGGAKITAKGLDFLENDGVIDKKATQAGAIMTTPTDGEWMHADDALAFLGTSHADAVDAICSRASNGLIRAKAEQYIDAGGRRFDNVELPKQFWWSSGEITGYWHTGDLETTPPEGRGRLQAFGVTFRRSDIERMRPSASATNARPPAGSGVLTSSLIEPTSIKPVASRKVFIVHGRDEGPREAIARFLERLGFEAIILHEQANQSRTVIEKIEGYSDVGFAVVLLTPDDEGNLKGGEPQPRARQNVLLELGYFIGKLTRACVCTLKVGELEIPSDWRGVIDEPFDAGGAWKQTLARELNAAGYDIDWNKVMRS
jgi:hypothetical protein